MTSTRSRFQRSHESRSISHDAQDATNGWITDIPAHITIHKERALRVYLLNARDLDDVPFDDGFNEYSERYFISYKERDVEWRAWEVHGGPIEYWKFYCRGRRYDLALAAPPALQDRYVGESPTLRDAKRTLQPWVWNACNIALDHVFLDGQAPLSAKDLTRDREVAMKLAVTFFSTHRQLYPGRPDEALPPSPSVEALRKVLSEAPIAPRPRSAQWGAPLQGLVFVRNEAYEYYDWNAEYLERVFTAARDVVGKHGACDGWAKARWDVYDKYSQSVPLGLRYDRDEKAWFDDAADWLDGRVPTDEMQGHIFSKCAVGIAFNELLPETLSSSTSS